MQEFQRLVGLLSASVLLDHFQEVLFYRIKKSVSDYENYKMSTFEGIRYLLMQNIYEKRVTVTWAT
jgi:hypothetical protein